MLWETIILAVQAIFRNALRSFLTVLGVVIGVAAVIAMVIIGQGSAEQVTTDVEKLGSNVLLIMPGQDAFERGARSVDPMFTLDDNNKVETQLGIVELSAPIAANRARAVFGNESRRTDIIGTDNRYFDAAEWEIERGRTFDPSEIQSGRSVCILGETVREALFGQSDPIGEAIRVASLSCEVIGHVRSKGASTFGSDQDDFILMPLRAYQRRIAGSSDVTMMFVSVRDGVSMERATQELELLMREIRRIGPREEDDFSVMDMEQIATMLTGITAVLTGLLSAVAAVSLLVGGIGIMNIMLVSVTERTREIGIRLAIGAQARQVLTQFLIEAIVLSLIGGFIGVVLGLTLAFVGSNLLNVPFTPDIGIVVMAFTFSAVVGVVFGYFPARRAARMDPIEALRRE
ncbi:MAG: ABC transporter permease [Rhizobiales bacterium]|nr:ABC transporter permease [Hyphomicrobiales bacterium]MBO6700369.1 ABC transporter permease [Hyphomicrobiales bacterium]MBO6737467.1 ABC transporter permease [Hyphomicrobiales bacterium]MBO6913476.1 ABC transporter permease [Hyphomicrobiales bacterium]MBO6955407.1 ABC transporter permease [Hyphomicrobiales bacterium]